MLETKWLVGKGVPSLRLIQKSMLRKGAKQHGTVSFSQVSGAPCSRSDAASERQRIGIGSSSIGFGRAVTACGVVKMGDGESNISIHDVGCGTCDGSVSVLIINVGIFEVMATPSDDPVHVEDFDDRTAGTQAEESTVGPSWNSYLLPRSQPSRSTFC